MLKKILCALLSLLMMYQPVSVLAEDGLPEEETGEVFTAEEMPAESEETAEVIQTDNEEPEETAEPVSFSAEETEPEPEEPAALEETPAADTESTAEENNDEINEQPALSEAEMRKKTQMAENHVLEDLAAKTEGVDYAASEAVILTDSAEYAQYAADAYGGYLERYDGRTAVIHLPEDLSVYEAVAKGMDPEAVLPVVDANWLITLDDPEITAVTEEKGVQLFAVQTPQKTNWQYWIEELEQPDPLLENTSYTAMETACWQWFHEAVGTYQAWGVTTGSADVKVAVIDSGVQDDHEDLAGRVTLRQVSDIPTSPSNGHGTHVAGIIAASLGNGKGGAGIAPEVSIYSYNVFRGSSASAADIASAILMAAEDQVWIMNMSFGTVSYSQTVQDAVNTAYASGVTIVSAIGNFGTNVKCYPAAYDHVIAVGATDRTNTRAVYSGYGEWCDIGAPGTEISSAFAGSTASGYRTLQGTSMSSPIVAGSAALYMSAYGHISPDAMEAVLKASTVKASGSVGAGIISLKKLFGKQESAPQIFFDQDTNILTLEKLTDDERAMILYTLDGSDPVIRKGTVRKGTVYTEPVDLTGKPYGTIVRVKAAVVSGAGVLGDISSAVVMTKAPQYSVAAVKIKSLKLTEEAVTLNYHSTAPGTAVLEAGEIVLEDGRTVTLADYRPEDRQWYSSNEAVVTVDQSGMITAAGKGTAYVYLKIRFQNAVKQVSCKVTVRQLAENITVKGRAGILPGKTLQMKAAVLPKNTNNTKVTWQIAGVSDPAYAGYASISKDGILSVKKGVPAGTEITVQAVSKDGSDTAGTYTVTVCSRASYVRVTHFGTKIKSAVLYNTDLPETYDTENVLQLESTVLTMIGESEVQPIWTSSAPKVAKVDAHGKVTAVGRGTAVITCKAADGSGEKASVKIKVKVPTSGVFIAVPAVNRNVTEDMYAMTVGTSAKLTAVIGKVYGKPSTSAVRWTLEEAVINGYSVWDEVRDAKLIKVSKSGKVTVSSKLLSKLGITNYQNGYIIVGVTAKDGTEHYDEVKIYLRKKITAMKMTVLMSGGTAQEIGDSTIAVSQNKSITVYAEFDQRPQSVTLKSSNADICGARVTAMTKTATGYRAEIKITGGLQAGKAYITVKENGSGQKRKVNIRVREAS